MSTGKYILLFKTAYEKAAPNEAAYKYSMRKQLVF